MVFTVTALIAVNFTLPPTPLPGLLQELGHPPSRYPYLPRPFLFLLSLTHTHTHIQKPQAQNRIHLVRETHACGEERQKQKGRAEDGRGEVQRLPENRGQKSRREKIKTERLTNTHVGQTCFIKPHTHTHTCANPPCAAHTH